MAAQTGRTVNRWIRFVVENAAGLVCEIPINSINGVGLTAEEIDVTAFQDPVKTVLPGRSDCAITIGGPFDSSAMVAASATGVAPVLSGSHTLLSGIYGLNVPLALGILFGIRHWYETTEPAFGLTATATVGFICTEYMVNPTECTYEATFKVYGTTAPSWINTIPTVA